MEKISGGKEKNKVVNELLKDNPHMSKKRVRETEKKRERKKKSCGLATKAWGGGRKLIHPATWRRGAWVVVVVGSTLWRALKADHVTMERRRDEN